MPESQSHGFSWEADIKTKVFRITETTGSYTDTHDIPKQHNRLNPNENISIKVTGSSTACMGDALRLFSYSPREIHTGIIVQYEQTPTHKVVTNIYEVDLDKRGLLWGNVTLADIRSFDMLVRSMPAGSRDKGIDTAIKLKKAELNAKSGIVKFNPKIDSKTQRRLQCSIPKFASFDEFIKVHSPSAQVRDIRISSRIESTRRVRNCKD